MDFVWDIDNGMSYSGYNEIAEKWNKLYHISHSPVDIVVTWFANKQRELKHTLKMTMTWLDEQVEWIQGKKKLLHKLEIWQTIPFGIHVHHIMTTFTFECNI